MNPGTSRSPQAQPEGVVVTLAEAFEAMPVELEGSAEALVAARLSAPVGAALMAALEWIAGDGGPRRPFRARADESCLEMSGYPGDLRGLKAAGEILGLVGGNLHPAGAEARGLWRVRVPLAAEPATYLMVSQGDLKLAFPWPAVLSVVMVERGALEGVRLGAPVLAPLAHDARPGLEIPVVLLGHGLKAAHVAADRLIWRMRGEAQPLAGMPPAAGLVHPVLAADGETYWLADPGLLLAHVESPPVREEWLPAREQRDAAPEPAGVSAPPAPPAPPAPVEAPEPAIFELTIEHVEPLVPATAAVTAPRPPLRPMPPAPAAAPPPAPSTRAPALRHALVAEDSFIARVFMIRMLEHRGFTVTAVASAGEMLRALPQDAWTLVCTDVHLGDGGGAPLLRQVRETLARVAATETRGRAAAPPVVALVRDARDIAEARAAGIALTLLKPFDVDAFESMLVGLDLVL
jgi:CheY-like chemotaxis protein